MCQTCGNRMHKRPISSQPSTLFPLSHSLIQNLLLWMNSSSLSLSLSVSRPLGFHGGTSKNLNRWEVARGHPLGAEHTHCAAACQALAPSRWHSQACRGIDPSSTLHTLHLSHCSATSAGICTSFTAPLSGRFKKKKKKHCEEEPAHVWCLEWESDDKSVSRAFGATTKINWWEWWMRKGRRGEGWERGMEDYHGPCCPPGSVWHQFEPSCQWVLIMEDWQHRVAAGS